MVSHGIMTPQQTLSSKVTTMYNQHWQTYPPPVPAVQQALAPVVRLSLCSPFCFGQRYRCHPSQHQKHGWGLCPSRNTHHCKGFRQEGTLYQNKTFYESSETIFKNGYTGLDPGMAWINTNDTRVGKVYRTPSRNPLALMHTFIRMVTMS